MCKVNRIPQFVWKGIIFELLMNVFPLTFPFLFDLSPTSSRQAFYGENVEQQVEKKSLLLLCCSCSVAKSCPTL